MPLIKLERHYTKLETYVNPDEIVGITQQITGNGTGWAVLVEGGIAYDVTEKFAKKLIKNVGVIEV